MREIGQPGLVRHGLRHTALTWMADAGVELHPDTQAMLDARTAFSAWWSETGPEKRHLGAVRDGRSGA